MKILTFLLFISLFTACHVNKETVESIHVKISLSNDIILKYPKSQYITHFYDKKDDTIMFDLSKQQFDSIQILYTKYVISYPNDTEIYLKNNSFETLAYETKYHFNLKNKNSKIIKLFDVGGNNVDKEYKNFMKFDTYIQKLLKSKKELKNKPKPNNIPLI
ncbi:hypothetical protein EB1_29980 [Empedobacter brevis NBRC 14943 = ATCC 43319]|uniref:Lipoprotein n=1 Tax=Empedobacter brevis NBRC 14943 = ATCC 43319 TaxID=1218108 RepID=A0A511NL91_9FLAO|nr:hypothetical protein [Empedobacter brevis]GEM53208.1 hypothetical protein EB1_29980 [Empedobacter brevis NBRC 14943 = ATCC 43319]